MKLALAAGLTLVAAPALAHAEHTIHTHGSSSVLWGAALAVVAICTALARQKLIKS